MGYCLTLTDPPVLLVCGLGIGVVFIGLILMVWIVQLMNLVFEKVGKPEKRIEKAAPIPPVSQTKIENKQEIIAAVCAAVAEENGTDISAIRVLSFKKIN